MMTFFAIVITILLALVAYLLVDVIMQLWAMQKVLIRIYEEMKNEGS